VKLITGTKPGEPADSCMKSYSYHEVILTTTKNFVNDSMDGGQVKIMSIVLDDLSDKQI
jgi:hypothetical protein